MIAMDDDWANCTCGLFEDKRSITKAGTCSYCLKRRDKENIEMGKIFGKESVHDIGEEQFKSRIAEERRDGAIERLKLLLKRRVYNERDFVELIKDQIKELEAEGKQ